MRPRSPSRKEFEQVADQIPGAIEKRKEEAVQKFYIAAYSGVQRTGSSGSPEGEFYRQTVGPSWKEYERREIDDKLFVVSFGASQSELSENLKGERRNKDGDGKTWDEVPVLVEMRVKHERTGVSSTFPVARLSPDRIEWADEVDGSAVVWRELDVLEEADHETLATLRDTIEFLKSERQPNVLRF